ncbi:hypothetical protein SAMN05518672_1011496 [Chitinophaga sp. CF118]|uniref:hypothetical protein n=1 Tax=Chitinophaga sp. CF118 TaxID=1884367 RepID=UPI0008E6C0C9|nr:hypothetical protein [Chitinophaga sp. CF118]SFD29686.1 hypothetical protein SAMN05518672_1011496 [Chitinophaga sp. CF118]
MRRLFLFIFTAFVLGSCGQSPSNNSNGASDVLAIKDPCAVIFRPAGDKLQSLKSDFGEKNFPGILAFNKTTITADSLFLASKGIKIITTSATQLQFVRRNGESSYINLNHPKYAWEIFLFTGFGDPVKADLGDIETAFSEAGFK